MKVRPATLRGRLTLSIFLLVAASVVVGLLTVERLLSRELTRELHRSAEAQLRYIEGVVGHHERGEDGFVREEMAELEAGTGALIEIRTADQLIFASPSLNGRHLPDRAGPATLNAALYEMASSDVGRLQLRLALPATSAERLHHALDLLMLALLSGGLILAGVVARVIAGRVAAPLDDMAAAAERVQAESLSKRLTVSSPAYDEVLRLATAFNQMLERLEGAVGRLRRFTADAAHELRTPLAGLKAQVQAALAAQPERDHAQATLQALLPEVNRLAELIERLLVLSRVDDRSVEREPIDFSDLVVERVERARGAADRAEVNLAMEITNPVQLRGDAVLLRQLADNLIDNAIKYTPAGGRVQVTLQSGGPTATLRVVDCGVGIAPAALPHIFERFYREDSSRARATGGVGLGLAIVTCVVEAHGGTVRVESEPGRGAIFEVVLPT